jgi:hypothetical protein
VEEPVFTHAPWVEFQPVGVFTFCEPDAIYFIPLIIVIY